MKRFKEISEQHREKGRFKPVKPHNVPNVAVASPRPSSDSASVKLKEDLRKWFSKTDPAGDWKRINSKGEVVGPCAREPGEPKPKCMSAEKRASLTKKERAAAVRAKRKHDPNPERKGEPINVSNFGKGKISENMENLNEKNVPTNPELWSRAKALARSKFDVYPSAYANGWASKWYKGKGGSWKYVSEAVKDKYDEGEYDQEGDMAKSDLRSIIANAKELHDMIDDAENLPEWCQSKITLAEDYISTVANYMAAEMNESSSARVRLAMAMKRAQEQREREERAGAALLKPKPKNEAVERIDEISKELTHSYFKQRYAQTGSTRQDKPKGMLRATHDKRLQGMDRARRRLTTTLTIPKGVDPSEGGKYTADSVELKGNVINEGRPSQRHPLEGHEYHKKTNAELVYIAKDAHKAAEAMKSHNTTAENKYRDQANDSATVRHYREKNGMPDWYKKKYGHVKEDVVQEGRPFRPMDEPNYKNSIQARQAAADKSSTALSGLVAKKNLKQAEGKNKSQEFINKMTSKVNAGKRLGEEKNDKPPFDGPYKKKPAVVTDKSGAKHSPMSRVRDLARAAAKKQGNIKESTGSLHESRKANIVREAMKVAKEKKKNNSEDKFIADPELNSKVIKTAAQM